MEQEEKPLSKRWFKIKIAAVVIFILGVIFALIITGIAQPYINKIPGLSSAISTTTTILPPSPYLALLAYNETQFPDRYLIVVRNIGNDTSSGMTLFLSTVNPNTIITWLDTDQLNISYPQGETIPGQFIQIQINNLQQGSWGLIGIELSNESKIKMKALSHDGPYCNSTIYNINGSKSNLLNGSIPTGNCNLNLFNYTLIPTVTRKYFFPRIDCLSYRTINYFSDVLPLNISIPTNTVNYLKYYIYKGNQSIENITTNHTFRFQINSSEPYPYYIEVYSPGNANYSCTEWLVLINNSVSTTIR